MHIRIDAGALRKALTHVKAGLLASDYYSTHPYVIVCTQRGHLLLSTWKKSLRIDASVPCAVEQEGSFAVSYQQLLQATGPLRGTLVLRQEHLDLLVSSPGGAQDFVLPIGGAEVVKVKPCPVVGEVMEGAMYTRKDNRGVTCDACRVTRTEKVELTYTIERVITQRAGIPKARLMQLLTKVNWLPAGFYQRPELEGICLEVASGKLSLIGADLNGLAIASAVLAPESVRDWERRVLVKSELFTKALRTLPRAEVCLEAVLTQHRLVQRNGEPVADTEPFEQAVFLRLSAGQVTATIPLMSLPIPNYRALIPTARITHVTCAAVKLRSALQALASVGTTVACHLTGATLALEVEHKPQPARHQVPVIEVEGPDAHLVFDAPYLLNALDHIPAVQVALEIHEGESPVALLQPVDNGEVSYLLVLQCRKG